MSEIAICVENLSKRYQIGAKRSGSFRETLTNAFRRKTPTEATDFWALKDVSFEIKRGEAVGIIGKNGAGKSTLLKVLSRITEPTHGRIEINGRVASLLEVGTGFHPELTGRENIYMNGTILGMTRREIKAKFDEIVDFSGIEKFIDTPVKHYSSGMYVRLAFAVAAHLEPEILIIDEVLAVGDAEFQRKCLGKMGQVTGEGRTVLFVSHNMAAIEGLCKEGIVLDKGSIVCQGTIQKTTNYYLKRNYELKNLESLLSITNRSGSGLVKLRSFHIEDIEGNYLSSVKSGMDIVLVFGYSCNDPSQVRTVDIGFSIHTMEMATLSVVYSSYLGKIFSVQSETGEFRFHLNKLILAQNTYRVGARILVNGLESDWPREMIGTLEVEGGDFYGTGSIGFGSGAPLLLSGKWNLTEFMYEGKA